MSNIQQTGQTLRERLSFSAVAAPQELDFLVNELRNPEPGTTVAKVLGYLYHYVPVVKNVHNLRVIIASFLNSPVCFSGSVPFEETHSIIEVFKLIMDKKLKISQPSLDIKTFYTVLLMELRNFVLFNQAANSWKVLPVISGLFLSNDLRDELYTRPNFISYKWFFADWDKEVLELYKKCLKYSLSNVYHDDIVNLSIVSLAITFKKGQNIHDYTKRHSDGFMVTRLVQLLFTGRSSALAYKEILADSNSEVQIRNNPVVKFINRISFLLEAYLQELPLNQRSFDLVTYTVDTMLYFNKELNQLTEISVFNTEDQNSSKRSPEFWVYMKGLLFAEVVIFQGLLSRFLTSKRFTLNPFHSTVKIESEYRDISLKILHSIYYLHFILLSIGQGGFDNFNFIYYLAVEVALQSDRFHQLTLLLIGWREVNLDPGSLNGNYIQRSKVLFTLGLWENYLQSAQKNELFIKNEIFPLCITLANDIKYNSKDIIEAAHSTLLFCFSNMSIDPGSITKYVDYFNILFSQFPSGLSSHQLSIAVETLGKKILSNPVQLPTGNSAAEFLDFILQRAVSSKPGIPIGKPKSITFSSAQPISEIGASSTLSNVDDSDLDDIISANKGDKPKDLVVNVPNLKDLVPSNISKLKNLVPPNVFSEGDSKEYTFENRLAPETVREAHVLCFINLVPYLPLSSLVSWLDKLWIVINRSNVSERNFLIGMLWKVLGENMDLNRGELALQWWYTGKGIPESYKL